MTCSRRKKETFQQPHLRNSRLACGTWLHWPRAQMSILLALPWRSEMLHRVRARCICCQNHVLAMHDLATGQIGQEEAQQMFCVGLLFALL